MARFKKKEKVQIPKPQETVEAQPVQAEVPAPAPVEKASLGEDLNQEGGLPLPEGEQPVKQAVSPLKVEEKPTIPNVVGVSDAPPTVAEKPKSKSAPSELVKVRGLRDLDSAPSVGNFNFAEAVGKEIRTGQIVRGKIKNGYVYLVPPYVADVMVEHDWGMRI